MIYFTGDINLTDNSFDIGYGIGSKIKKGWNPFHNIDKVNGDVWIGNFEGVTSNKSDCTGYSKNSFRIEPEYLKDITFIDYWGVANNHVMEHGQTAFQEMKKALSSISKGVFGSIDKHSEIFVNEGKIIAVTGFSLRHDQLKYQSQYWLFPNADEIIDEYERIKKADIKIAYIHWGVEFIDYPYWEQRMYAQSLVEKGYDIIIGMHPHILQGYEVYKGKFIFYSLGNFVFNQGWYNTRFGIVVKVNPKDKAVSFDYIKIEDDNAPKIISKEQVPYNLRLEQLNSKINVTENLEVYIAKSKKGLACHRKFNHKSILQNLYRNDKRAVMGIIIGYIKRRLKF